MSTDELKTKLIKKFEKELEDVLVQYEFWRVKSSTLDKLIESLKKDIGGA